MVVQFKNTRQIPNRNERASPSTISERALNECPYRPSPAATLLAGAAEKKTKGRKSRLENFSPLVIIRPIPRLSTLMVFWANVGVIVAREMFNIGGNQYWRVVK
jgi:hypothetical protein